MNRSLEPGMIVLDIGANIGFYSHMMARLVGQYGHVHAFEVERLNLKHLGQVVGAYPNVTIHPIGISTGPGIHSLQLNPKLNVDHHLATGPKTTGYPVTVDSVDHFCTDWQQLDFIKMDIQGGEYHALKGMQKTCQRFPKLKLLIEYWPFGLARSSVSGEKVLQLIDTLGLQIKCCFGESLEALDDSSPSARYTQILLAR